MIKDLRLLCNFSCEQLCVQVGFNARDITNFCRKLVVLTYKKKEYFIIREKIYIPQIFIFSYPIKIFLQRTYFVAFFAVYKNY